MSAASGTSGPVHRVKSSTSTVGPHEIGYPHGHLGHLTAEEEDALVRFKEFLVEKGSWTPGPPPSHDDPTLLRFLRARRWVVEDAYKQFKDTEDWRQANHVEMMYDTIDVDAYEQSRRLYPQWTGRRDRRGIPVYLFEIRHLDSKTIQNYEKNVNKPYSQAPHDGKTPHTSLRLFTLYENLTRFVQPLCTELTDRDHPQTPITLSTNIVDVSGVSLRQFWNLKAHMQAASTIATANYPETLDRIFIIGAPMFFSTVWGWIKRWFDPVTVSKIFILGHHEVKPTLEAYIDPKNIPKQFGGELDFSWEQMPNMDPKFREVAVWENGYTDIPIGPLYWRAIDGGKRLECVAMGYKDGKQRQERICTIPVAFPKEDVAKTEANGQAVEPAPASEVVESEKPVATHGVERETVTAGSPTETTDSAVEGIQNLSVDDASKANGSADVSEKVAETVAESKEVAAATA